MSEGEESVNSSLLTVEQLLFNAVEVPTKIVFRDSLSTLNQGSGVFFFRKDKLRSSDGTARFYYRDFVSGDEIALADDLPNWATIAKKVSSVQSDVSRLNESQARLFFAIVSKSGRKISVLAFLPDLEQGHVNLFHEISLTVRQPTNFAQWLKSDSGELYLFEWRLKYPLIVYGLMQIFTTATGHLQSCLLTGAKAVTGSWHIPFIMDKKLHFVAQDAVHEKLLIVSLDGRIEQQEKIKNKVCVENLEFPPSLIPSIDGKVAYFCGYVRSTKKYKLYLLGVNENFWNWAVVGDFEAHDLNESKYCNLLPILKSGEAASESKELLFHGTCSQKGCNKTGHLYNLKYKMKDGIFDVSSTVSSSSQEAGRSDHLTNIKPEPEVKEQPSKAVAPPKTVLSVPAVEAMEDKIAAFTSKCALLKTKILLSTESTKDVNILDESKEIGANYIKLKDELDSTIKNIAEITTEKERPWNEQLLRSLRQDMDQAKSSIDERVTFVLMQRGEQNQTNFSGHFERFHHIDMRGNSGKSDLSPPEEPLTLEQKIIQHNLSRLCMDLDDKPVVVKMAEKEALTALMVQRIENPNNIPFDRNYLLIRYVQKGRPEVFKIFANALRETGQQHLAELLEHERSEVVQSADAALQDEVQQLMKRNRTIHDESEKMSAKVKTLEEERRAQDEKIANLERVNQIMRDREKLAQQKGAEQMEKLMRMQKNRDQLQKKVENLERFVHESKTDLVAQQETSFANSFRKKRNRSK